MIKRHRQLIERYRVKPGSRLRLRKLDPADDGGPAFAPPDAGSAKERAAEFLVAGQAELAEAQELLWASDTYSVLIVLQGMDAAGKDGTIKHVMSGVNAQGSEVHSFKHPSEAELEHDFLWRYAEKAPERGRIGIFNRSYFEEVLVVKVHPQVLAAQRLPPGRRGRRFWQQRYEAINHFEHHLVSNGTLILKFFLNVSKAEQKRRLLERIDDKAKRWKFSAADLEERGYWAEYMQAYQDMLRATSTRWAPWYVIPADHKPVARALVAQLVSGSIRALGLHYPAVSAGELRQLRAARRRLLGGG